MRSPSQPAEISGQRGRGEGSVAVGWNSWRVRGWGGWMRVATRLGEWVDERPEGVLLSARVRGQDAAPHLHAVHRLPEAKARRETIRSAISNRTVTDCTSRRRWTVDDGRAEQEQRRGGGRPRLPAVHRSVALLALGGERLAQEEGQLADVPEGERVGEAGVRPEELGHAGGLRADTGRRVGPLGRAWVMRGEGADVLGKWRAMKEMCSRDAALTNFALLEKVR